MFSVINKEAAEMAAATIRTIFAQPTADAVRTQLDTVADMLGKQFPKVKEMLLEAKDDLTAFAAFPERHWKKIQSTNPLERINREVKRRTDVVQVSPTTTRSCDWSPPCSSNCTTSGSPSPAAPCPREAWTSSTPPSAPKAPPRYPTPPTRPPDDRLHHEKGHDCFLRAEAPPQGQSRLRQPPDEKPIAYVAAGQ